MRKVLWSGKRARLRSPGDALKGTRHVIDVRSFGSMRRQSCSYQRLTAAMQALSLHPQQTSWSRRSPTGRRGFTLIEVLMVVTAMAIIAGVVVPQVATVIDDAKNSALLKDLREFTFAIERYRMDRKIAAAGTVQIGSAREKRAVIICCPGYSICGCRKRTFSTNPERGDRIVLSMAACLGLKVWLRFHGLLKFWSVLSVSCPAFFERCSPFHISPSLGS